MLKIYQNIKSFVMYHFVDDIFKFLRYKYAVCYFNIKKYLGYDYVMSEDVNNEYRNVRSDGTVCFIKKFNEHPIILEPNIKRLFLGCNFNQLIVLTKTLTHLTIDKSNFNKTKMPKNLICLILCDMGFEQCFVLTKKLYSLRYSSNVFNSPIKLSKNLRVVSFGKKFNQPIKLSKNMIYAKVGECFNHPIELTKTLKYLILGHNFNQSLKTQIPKTLICLHLSSNFNEHLVLEYPLEFLCFGENNEFMHDNMVAKNQTFTFVEHDVLYRKYDMLYYKKAKYSGICPHVLHPYSRKKFSFE